MKKRNHFTAAEKVSILRRHLLKHEPVSDICDDLGIYPTLFYRWQKTFFEKGGELFQGPSSSTSKAQERKIAELEAKLSGRNELVSELLEENLKLKKKTGVSSKG